MKITTLNSVQFGQEVTVMYSGGYATGTVVNEPSGDSVTVEVSYKILGQKFRDGMVTEYATVIRSIEKGGVFIVN